MHDCQHTHMIRKDPISDDERKPGHNQFTSARDTSRPALLGEVGKGGNRCPDALSNNEGHVRSLTGDVGTNLGQVGEGFSMEADLHRNAAKAASTSSSVAKSSAPPAMRR